MNHVLMCPPRYYSIRYEINPWMKIDRPVTKSLARRQWDTLVNTLLQLGVTVTLVPQAKNCPDMVFTANAGVVRKHIFIPSHFRFPQRQPETPLFTQFFLNKGYDIADAAHGFYFEGEGDLLSYRNVLFGGTRFRSEAQAHQNVATRLRKKVVLLELIHPRFYHLDTCFFPLNDQTALYYPGAFDAAGRKALRQHVKNLLTVDKIDAYQFACNAFRVDHSVVVNTVSRAFKQRLYRLGYDTLETPTSEFVKAGGSVKCLLLKL